MFGLMFRALTHRPDKNLLRQFKPPVLPAITREQIVTVDPSHYQRYATITGWQHEAMHPCYLQVLSLPLQMQCLAHKRSPFPLLGLVHRANTIRQKNHADINMPFELRVGFSEIAPHAKGWDVKMVSRVLQNNVLVYEAEATYLVRVKAPHVGTDGIGTVKPARRQQGAYPQQVGEVSAPSDIGRRYARVSGDANPIHLFDVTANLFGFPSAIAHGMWTRASSVSLLYPSAPVTEVAIECGFKKPLLLPGAAVLKASKGEVPQAFLLENAASQEPVLTGTIHNYFSF